MDAMGIYLRVVNLHIARKESKIYTTFIREHVQETHSFTIEKNRL